MAQQISTNTFGTAKWVVSATASDGTHTTIGAALTSASSGDTIFIRPGTYTENLTLKAGVNLAAYTADAFNPNVIILGKATFTAAGTVAISGVQLKTNSDFFLAVTGSAASIVRLVNCNLNSSNNTGISFTSSSASALIHMLFCTGDIGTTGIGLFAATSAGGIVMTSCRISNNGATTTSSTVSVTSLNMEHSNIFFPITTASTSVVSMQSVTIGTSGQNTACLVIAGTGTTHNIQNSNFSSGTASAITIGSGSALSLSNCTISSSNTNNITGAGTLSYSGNSFTSIVPGTSPGVNVTTLSPKQFGTTLVNTQQPCFLAYLNSTAVNVTGDGTVARVPFDTVVFDNTGSFTTGASAQFTAPVTGRYLFSTVVEISPGISTTTLFLSQFAATSRSLNGGLILYVTTGTTCAPTNTAIIDMTAGDTLRVNAVASNGTKTASIVGSASPYSTYVSGYLVC